VRRAAALLAGATLVAACRHAAPPAPAPAAAAPAAAAAAPAGPSLYARLGGADAIRAVVGDFLTRVAADARINAFFRGVDLDSLGLKLTDEICETTGGPCRYTGKSMREAHAEMEIGNADFDALMEDLAASLDHASVGPNEERELLRALDGLREQIVRKR
jgi:hemoglobin